MSQDVVIVGGARTPMREYVGDFKDVSALELGAHAARAALERAGAKPEWVDHVVMGNALQTSGDALYGARDVGLKAGAPIETPALTVNRLCGSGIQSVVSAAQMILLGKSRLALAGGMENTTQAPHVRRGARAGFRLGEGKLEDSLMVSLLDTRPVHGPDLRQAGAADRRDARRDGRLRPCAASRRRRPRRAACSRTRSRP